MHSLYTYSEATRVEVMVWCYDNTDLLWFQGGMDILPSLRLAAEYLRTWRGIPSTETAAVLHCELLLTD